MRVQAPAEFFYKFTSKGLFPDPDHKKTDKSKQPVHDKQLETKHVTEQECF